MHRLRRPPFLSRVRPAAACVLLLFSWVACDGANAPAERRNIVLISIDTMRPDYLGCYGHEREVSPRIDAFADGGTVFDDVTSAAPWTLPSHATMLTGEYPSTHGVRTHDFSLTDETLATWLHKQGYQTMAVVNSHNIGYEQYGLMRGYDPGKGKWVTEVDMLPDGSPGTRILNRAEKIIQVARKFLGERDPARPFFLFLHFYDVHTDFTPDPKWEREFVEPYRGRLTGVTADLVKARNQIMRGEWQLGDADIAFLEEMYDAEIRTFDTSLGVFFDYLRDAGLEDSTVVAITSDHGEEYGEHGSILHGRTHYRELVHIPWILRGPGVPVGERIATPVHLIDVAPTLYSLAGVPAPEGIDGLDATLLWRDPSEFPEARFLFSEADHNNIIEGKDAHDIKRMVRLGTKVLHRNLHTGEQELYDLSNDPFEQHDLAADDPEMVELLGQRLDEFMKRQGSARSIAPPSEETMELLQTLGYVGGDDE